MGRLLRVVGAVIEDAMAEEGWQPPEGDGSSFMQGSLITTPSDWEAFLADLRATLEQMSKGPRLANSVLWRWLEYRCADTASGRCLGHMQGRVAEMLALLVVAMEASAGVEEVPEWHEDWCNIWYRRMSLFLPTHSGSRKARASSPCRTPSAGAVHETAP